MSTTDMLRNNIIDKLFTITNKDYLSALYQLVNSNSLDYQSLEINETSGKEIYQVTYEEAMLQIRKVKRFMEIAIYSVTKKMIR